MDKERLNQIVTALNKNGVNQPCPRCSFSNFSVVGESEITVNVEQQKPQTQGLLSRGRGLSLPTIKTTMPTIVVACDNCGYISHHSQVKLDLLHPAALGLGLLGNRYE